MYLSMNSGVALLPSTVCRLKFIIITNHWYTTRYVFINELWVAPYLRTVEGKEHLSPTTENGREVSLSQRMDVR